MFLCTPQENKAAQAVYEKHSYADAVSNWRSSTSCSPSASSYVPQVSGCLAEGTCASGSYAGCKATYMAELAALACSRPAEPPSLP